MKKTLNRRDFIKISGLGLGAAAVAGSIYKFSEGKGAINPKFKSADPFLNCTPTFCEMCTFKCAGWVYKKDSLPWKIVGNEKDEHCYGRLCTKGTSGFGTFLDPDRLKTPLIRVNERGKQTFREASWDEAFDYIATKMKTIAEKHGPESMALFSHGSGGSFFKTLLKAYGSDAITAPSYANCRGPREEAYFLTFGETIESPERTDIKNTDCLVLIGSHLGENTHSAQVNEFADAIGRGASIITVDPRFSVAASKSKYWLAIEPGTDLALLLAWINVILEENLYDKDYVARYCIGLDKLQEAVKSNTPEWAYPITTIKPEVIRETAREMVRYAPATIVHPGRHNVWYGDDTQRVRAGAIINALLGTWGRKGGFYIPAQADVPSYPHPEFPPLKKSWREAFPGKYELASSALSSGICEATIPGATDKSSSAFFKGWIVYGTNLIHTLPNPDQTLKAIQNLDLLVAIDILPAEITGWADVVLPECTYLERYDDIRTSPGRKPQIALRMPAFEPLYDSKPAWWMAKKLSEKLGLGHYFPWADIESYLDYSLKKMGSLLAEMKKLGVKTLPQDVPIYFGKDEEVTFNTPSKKIELYSEALASYGFDPVPKFRPHEKPASGYYRLLYGRSPSHSFGRTANNPLLTQLAPENEVWINPITAKEWSIENEQYVRLENQDGKVSNLIKVRITERIRPDSVYMAHGFGHTQKKMKLSFMKGADDTGLMTRVDIDPIMGGNAVRNNFVTFKI